MGLVTISFFSLHPTLFWFFLHYCTKLPLLTPLPMFHFLYFFFFCQHSPIPRKLANFHCVSRPNKQCSNTELEYRALANSVAEIAWNLGLSLWCDRYADKVDRKVISIYSQIFVILHTLEHNKLKSTYMFRARSNRQIIINNICAFCKHNIWLVDQSFLQLTFLLRNKLGIIQSPTRLNLEYKMLSCCIKISMIWSRF